MMNTIIADLFNNPECKKFFKRLPAKVAGASNVYLIKMNYNYSNQNAYSFLNGCIFKCDVEQATFDDIDILVNVLPNISYSTKLIENAKKQFKYYDGTWFRLYWNKYLDEWKFATSQLVNGEIASWNNVKISRSMLILLTRNLLIKNRHTSLSTHIRLLHSILLLIVNVFNTLQK